MGGQVIVIVRNNQGKCQIQNGEKWKSCKVSNGVMLQQEGRVFVHLQIK